MEGGDYGGLQRWQLTIIHLSFGERKLYFQNFKNLAFWQGFLHTGEIYGKCLKDIIEKKKITDELLNKSRVYINSKPDKDIKSRIEELRFLEEYLDTNNIIRIYNTQNDKYLHSLINADYIIESQFKGSVDIVYIFLKRREENPEYLCVESFFKKDKITYGGNKLYWLLKEKITTNEHITLYKHKDYVQS